MPMFGILRWSVVAGLTLWPAVAAAQSATPAERHAEARAPVPTAAGASTQPADARPSFVVGLGASHLRALDRSTTWRVEYRHRALLPWRIQPFAGADLGEDRSRYVYLGVLRVLPLGWRLRLTPSLGVGHFADGTFTLGYPLEFRSGVELGVRLPWSLEFGAAVHHVSNGGLGRLNPGSEQVVVVSRFPLR
ncbi:MAG TPA: acyloxyacyl hydrolase [Arachnia sp.]|nr:acyloxyacyl hydrolase [Arachnia sp.]